MRLFGSARLGRPKPAVRHVSVLAVAALAVIPLLGATASDPRRAVSRDGGIGQAAPDPQDDWLGSQIRKHEGDTPAPVDFRGPHVYGMDVSSHQGNVNWTAAYARGARFAYVKATEGVSYKNPYFGQQYPGALRAGLVRGAYHFALPNRSSGSTQALYFIQHGGGWSPDGRTLPPALDIEYNPYSKAECYGLSRQAMVGWIRDFSATMHARTGRYPVIYTSINWWKRCTGDSAAFSRTDPLWIGGRLHLPTGWTYYTFWQFALPSRVPSDIFNGSDSRLTALATTRS